MQNLAQHTQMPFMDPFITSYYAAYLPYNSSMDNLTPGAVLSQESLNQQNALYTSTAMSYYGSLVSPPGPNSSIDSQRRGRLLRVAQWLADRHHSQYILFGFRARAEHHVYLHHPGLRPGRKRLGLLPPAQCNDQGHNAAQCSGDSYRHGEFLPTCDAIMVAIYR